MAQGDAATPPARRRIRVLAAVLIGGLIAVVGVQLRPDDRPRTSSATRMVSTATSTVPTTTSTTTTTAPPPTTAPGPPPPTPKSPTAPVQVASAVGEALLAFPEPTDAVVAPPEPAGLPPYSPNRFNVRALPREDLAVTGRRVGLGGWVFDNPGPYGTPLTLLVTGQAAGWVRVMLPVRPNGTEAWVKAQDVTLSTVDTRIEVSVSERKARAWRGTTLLFETPVTVGTSDSRTPLGRHFISDREAHSPGSMYGPWALGTNAYSEDLDSFDGGAPQIALHGWQNREAFGRAISNGCIRVPNEFITQIADFPLGTPVDVWA